MNEIEPIIRRGGKSFVEKLTDGRSAWAIRRKMLQSTFEAEVAEGVGLTEPRKHRISALVHAILLKENIETKLAEGSETARDMALYSRLIGNIDRLMRALKIDEAERQRRAKRDENSLETYLIENYAHRLPKAHSIQRRRPVIEDDPDEADE